MRQVHWKRRAVHIGCAVFALAIGRFSPLMVVFCCVAAFIFNAFVLPRLAGPSLDRPEDQARGYSLGILLYPAVLTFLSLLFIDEQIILAAAWGAMAFGDGFAGLVGEGFGGRKIPWNARKSIIGTWAFMLIGWPLTFGLLAALPEETRLGLTLAEWAIISGAAIAVSAWVETLPGTIDDNLAVPLSAAATTSFLLAVQPQIHLPSAWPLGLALVLILVVGSIASRKIDVPGGLVGGLLAAAIFAGSGLPGLLWLALFFVLGSFASHWGKKEKAAVGLAQEAGGKRGVRHALANGGTAAICGICAWFLTANSQIWQIMAAASLASAAADTMSSEFGNIYGRRFFNILTFKQDRRGLDGVVSLEGTLFGALGAAVIAISVGFSHGFWPMALIVFLAGLFGNWIDSILGASLQRWGYMTNDTVNFGNTLTAAMFALLLFQIAAISA